MDSLHIMVVERTRGVSEQLRAALPGRPPIVHHEVDLERAVERFESITYDILIVTNLAVEDTVVDAFALLRLIASQSPATQVLFLVQPEAIETAREALRAGSYQYATLPVSDEELRLLVEAAIEARPHAVERAPSEGGDSNRRNAFAGMVGESPGMRAVYRSIRQAAATDVPVLITGETGTGKDLAAQAIHHQSDRKGGPFVPVHLGAAPPDLVASEVFGHEKGAFTGAEERREGMLERAHGGTIFLDEIATLDEKVQISLLRLIEEKKFSRLGGKRLLRSSARVVAATNTDLAAVTQAGEFREDLFYRLDVFNIPLPPLRERTGDLSLLIESFLHACNRAFGKDVRGLDPGCIRLLSAYAWPGNVRELKNSIQRAVVVCQGNTLLPDHLPERIRADSMDAPDLQIAVGVTLAEAERHLIRETLRHTGNNRTRAAELLGIGRRTLYSKLEQYQIN